MHFRTLNDLDVRGKRVLVREDLNVPFALPDASAGTPRDDKAIADYTRIDAAIPTLRRLSDNGARVVILSHLGRPNLLDNGEPDEASRAKFSLRTVAAALSERLGKSVAFASDCIGNIARDAVTALHDGDLVLLENVRFHTGEEANDLAFARELASLGDLYVNDAFGTAHRAHASTEGVAHLLPNAAGLLMESELAALSQLVDHPAQPYICAIGGAKVKDKVGVFTNLIERVQAFCIGGGMANTFLAAQGVPVGKSLRDDDLEPAKEILALARNRNIAFHLPNDAVVAPSFDADKQAHTVPLSGIGNEMILDIGPGTSYAFAAVLENAKTIVFNGPMGVYEKPAYQNGTRIVGDAIARATARGAFSVIGGGDAAAAAHMLGFADKVTHMSTGGGATLEFLEGRKLPGITALCR